jgi:Mg-chelatase subunit ChlD
MSDLRRAVRNGGDVSSFADLYWQTLGGCPVPVVSDFSAALEIPFPDVLIERVDMFAGTTPLRPHEPLAGAALAEALEVRTLARPLYGRSDGRYLENIIGESHPDLIGLDCSPLELGAHIPYAFSLACAVGVPAQFEIIHGSTVEARFNGLFHPANTGISTLLESWLRRIPLLPVGRPLGPHRNTPLEDARYIASRAVDAARYSAALGRKVRLLIIVDPERYEAVQQFNASFRHDSVHDLYSALQADLESGQSFMVGECVDIPSGDGEETRSPTAAQERFRFEFERSVEALSISPLTTSQAASFVTEITGRTRRHRDIARGASVRGSIAFDELVGGLSNLHGGLTPQTIMKAALIALPPRISPKHGGNATALISDIAKEVLFRLSFSAEEATTFQAIPESLPADNIMSTADDAKRAPRPRDMEADVPESFAVVPDIPRDNRNTGRPRELDLPPNARQNEYAAIKKAVMRLIGDLDEQLRAGRITPDEYERHKAGLMARLEKAASAQLSMSNRELASTIIEMMDAQDGQWNTEVSLNRMRVYYHVKGTCEGLDVNPLKQDYHALKWLLDDLQQQSVLSSTGDVAEFTITGLALDSLLQYLMGPDAPRNSTPSTSASGTEFTNYRAQEVRRYSPGDTFRDLSVRHSLREIARKQKGLSDVATMDLRVFLKERHKPQVDVVFCIDVSGSMGFRQKLVYARLVAAGLVEAAFHEGNRAGVVAFNDYGQTRVPLTGRDKDSLFNGIAGLTPRGNTNIGDGISSARDLLLHDRSRNRKQIVLISDGQASAMSAGTFAHLSAAKGRDLTQDAALYETNRAAAAGVQVSVVFIASRDDADDLFIKDLAKAGRGTVRRLGDLADIKAMLRR